MPTPTYHLPNLKFDYYMIVPHHCEAKVLLLAEEKGWILPYFVPVEHHFGIVGHINQSMQTKFGISVTVLRCLYNHFNPVSSHVERVYLLENHSPDWQPPATGSWVSRCQLNHLKLAVPEQGTILQTWFDEVEGVTTNAEDVPWAIPGWFEDVKSWIYQQLNYVNLSDINPHILEIKQLKSWDLASVWQVKTTQGNLYFKATPARFFQEAIYTQSLRIYYPQNLPQVLAINPEKGWFLMRDVAGLCLEQIAEIEHWEAALRRFAEIQIDSSRHIDSLMTAGWLDLRINRIEAEINRLFSADISTVSQIPTSQVSREGIKLLAFLPKIKAMFARLRQLQLPETLIHGDLSPRNICFSHNHYVFFDWSDSCISYPFFDVVRFLYEIEKDRPDIPNIRTRLRNAYLQPWTIYQPMDRLIHGFELASETLISIYEVILESRLLLKWVTQVKFDNRKDDVYFYIQRLIFQVKTYLQLSLKSVMGNW